jgi:hypothetical protein
MSSNDIPEHLWLTISRILQHSPEESVAEFKPRM